MTGVADVHHPVAEDGLPSLELHVVTVHRLSGRRAFSSLPCP
jgi:hypothetical protein